LAALFNFFSLGTKVEPKVTFHTRLNEQICPTLTSPVKEVKFFVTPISSGNKNTEFNPEKTFQDLQEISTNLDRWNKFNSPTCNLQAFNAKSDFAFMQKVEAEFDKNSDLKKSFENSLNNFESKAEFDSANDEFLQNTALGKHIFQNYGKTGLDTITNSFRVIQSENEVTIFDRWAHRVNSICFSKAHFNYLEELKIKFGDFTELCAERKSFILSAIKDFKADLEKHPALFMNLAGYSNFSFIENFKNYILDMGLFKNLLDFSGYDFELFKALLTALFKSKEKILSFLVMNKALEMFPYFEQVLNRRNYINGFRDERARTACNFAALEVVSQEIEISNNDLSDEKDKPLNSWSSVIFTLGVKFLLSKTVISSLVLGSFFALSKTIFFKNMVSKFSQFFLKK